VVNASIPFATTKRQVGRPAAAGASASIFATVTSFTFPFARTASVGSSFQS